MWFCVAGASAIKEDELTLLDVDAFKHKFASAFY